jgi:predicted PurR-regulated permease PerM
MLNPSDGFTFPNFLADAFSVFLFAAWLFFLIMIGIDLFRRHDISGLAKALWVIALLLFSFITVVVYLITQGHGMAQRTREFRDELRHTIGFSTADEISKLDALRQSGSITEEEFARLRAKLMQ